MKYKFISLKNAENFRDRLIKIWLIVLGDDSKYWVVTPSQATRLEKLGYEIAS